MRAMHRRMAGLLGLGMLLLATAACGTKRPPAIAGGQAGTQPGAGQSTPDMGQPVDDGQDVRPLSDDGLSGSELGADGEGGPLADIRFDYDQASLSDEARATLEKHALWLQSRRGVKVLVEGHCDERGTVDYNLALGEQRARAARDYLVQLGVEAGRLRSVSYGKERPLDSGHGEAAWARNRRAHFVVER